MSDSEQLEARFEITDWVEEQDERAGLTRVTYSKRYQGEIDGTGHAQMLLVRGDGRAGYVASETIVGTLRDRYGTFAIQHGGLDQTGARSAFGAIVDAHGELSGLRGEAGETTEGVLTLRVADWGSAGG